MCDGSDDGKSHAPEFPCLTQAGSIADHTLLHSGISHRPPRWNTDTGPHGPRIGLLCLDLISSVFFSLTQFSLRVVFLVVFLSVIVYKFDCCSASPFWSTMYGLSSAIPLCCETHRYRPPWCTFGFIKRSYQFSQPNESKQRRFCIMSFVTADVSVSSPPQKDFFF